MKPAKRQQNVAAPKGPSRRKAGPPTPELATLPKRLKQAIKDSGVDAKTIAERSGVDAGQISRLGKGEQLSGVAADGLVRLAKALGVTAGFLIAGERVGGEVTIAIGKNWKRVRVTVSDDGTFTVLPELIEPG